MRCPIVVQTCDKYERFWNGFFRFMGKHWDPSIGQEIYFCNEEAKIDLPPGFRHLPTGNGSFTENLRTILERIGEDRVFYMLEDFWPIAPMTQDTFSSLHKFFLDREADALQVSSYLPYYSLETTDFPGLFKFKRDSDWIFNFQARFWKTETFLKFLAEPEISESQVGSAITVEMASDKSAKEKGGLSAFLFHYFWYPISGVSYRGEFTDIGKDMQNVAEIDGLVESMFNKQPSWGPTRAPLRQLSNR